MTTKFTPGPWVTIAGTKASLITNKSEVGIGFVSQWADSPEASEESTANAHLIAAAPTMYEVLDWLDHKGGLGLDVHAVISTALASARGEA